MQLAPGHRIQGTKGLIQEDPLALEAGCPQEGGSLAHTPRQGLRIVLGPGRQLELLKELLGLGAGLRLLNPRHH